MALVVNDLYLTLFSNASEKYYPNNTLTNFTNKLCKELVFDTQYKWMVGLTNLNHKVSTNSYTPLKNSFDEIVFPAEYVFYADDNRPLDFSYFIMLLVQCSKNPNIYGPNYFFDYLKENKVFKFNNKKELISDLTDMMEIINLEAMQTDNENNDDNSISVTLNYLKDIGPVADVLGKIK